MQDQHKTKEQLINKEETQQLAAFSEIIVNSMAEGILVEDADGTITFVNPMTAKLLGYATEELLGQHWTAIVPAEHRATVAQETARRPEGVASRYETALLRKDDREVPVIVSARLLFDNGRFTGVLSVFTDITERKRAQEELKQSFEKLQSVLGSTIQAMARIVETRDLYTACHQRWVAQLACAIAKEMGLSEEQITGVRMAAVVHDVGKIAVPAEILSKPARLTETEFSLIKDHPQVGHDILNGAIEFPWPVAQIVLQHHERMDGSGYPQGLSAEEILLEARILGVADVVEAMSSHRPYRPAHGIDKAPEETSQNTGIVYDPQVADACLKLFTEKGFTFE